MRLKTTLTHHRRWIIVVLHLVMTVVSNYVAFLLRFDGEMPPEHVAPFLKSLPWLLAIRGVTFGVFRLYRGLWRYASLWDLQNIILAAVCSTALFAVVVLDVIHATPYPRSIFFVDAIILIGLIGGMRLARRVYHEFDRVQRTKRILILGAGDAGELIVRDMRNNGFYNCEPVGFVDDDPSKVGQTIHGVRVLGTRQDLAQILAREQPHEVIVAIPRAEPSEIRSFVKSLEPFKIPIKTLPNLRDLLDGRIEMKQVRNMSLEDLMTRRPIGLDHEPVRRLVNGRRVLVTGAGGSIGSELSRQLAGFGPAYLILLDRYENTLFEVAHSITASSAFTPVIADICDEVRMNRVFEQHRPDIVFHAAAHKHVPLMETNPSEAVKNNITGTRVLAELAITYAVGEFVLISSDKAVNPSSVMGASKRVGEMLVRCYAGRAATQFMAVRFGNVLGSNGSVARIFEQQIARGGPVTVTHPEMRRYFMLIPEAVSLVLHAAATRETNAIFALDMGEPIRIVDFARNMIRLAGFVPDQEIAITFTGIRPGEKLFEELWEDGEVSEASGVEKVFRVRSTPVPETFPAAVAALQAAAVAQCDTEVLKLFMDVIPTFRAQPPTLVQSGSGGPVEQGVTVGL